MPKEKEIEEFKPNGWLYVFLFIYYSVWMINAYGTINFFWIYGLEEIQKYGTYIWFYTPLYLIASLYSLYAVVKVLRGDQDCITAIKWSLIVVFAYTLVNNNVQILSYNPLVRISMYLLRPVFYLSFFLYLCIAKSIKIRFPKTKRKFSPSGWVWLSIVVLFSILTGSGLYYQYLLKTNSLRIDLSELSISKGEICDGYVSFKSKFKWEPIEEETTLGVEDLFKCTMTMSHSEPTRKISLFSGSYKPQVVIKYSSTRLHNYIIYRIFGDDPLTVKEIGFQDTILNDNHFIYTIFESMSDQQTYSVTVMSVMDTKSLKMSVVTDFKKSLPDEQEMIELAKSLTFDLKKKRIHQIAGDEKKYDDTDMVP